MNEKQEHRPSLSFPLFSAIFCSLFTLSRCTFSRIFLLVLFLLPS
jgi:hypothetical protein